MNKKRRVVFALLILLGVAAARPAAQTIYQKGTTLWDPLQATIGLTFISAPDGTARLIGMSGDVINTWTAGPNDPLGIKMPILGSPGHILALRQPVFVPDYGRPRGTVIAEYDYHSQKVWEYAPGANIGTLPFAGFHHDMQRLPNGDTLALASVRLEGSAISPKALIDDCILEISPGGTIVWEWHTFQHFEEFGFSDTARQLISQKGGDWAHANSVTVIPDNTLGDARFTPGNLMVSYRNLNTVIVIDKSSGQVAWRMGPDNNLTIGQHYVHMIAPGLEGASRIMAFDNGGPGGYPEVARPFTRVVEIDPLTMTIPKMYTASSSGLQNWSFFSPYISNAQRLPRGNTLIIEGTKGRIFEVTSTGKLVWEYMSPFAELRQEADGAQVIDTNIYRAFRLPIWWPFFGVEGTF